MYSVELPGLSADLTLWFVAQALVFASYSLPVTGTAGEFKAHFEQVSGMLQERYGKPFSRASSDDVYTTETWILEQGDIEHTVRLDRDRPDHTVVFTAPQPWR